MIHYHGLPTTPSTAEVKTSENYMALSGTSTKGVL